MEWSLSQSHGRHRSLGCTVSKEHTHYLTQQELLSTAGTPDKELRLVKAAGSSNLLILREK